MTKEKIDRINELARKMRTIGLTLEEKAEQQDLRDDGLDPRVDAEHGADDRLDG